MQHYWMKECPRCEGDLREEQDMYGTYIQCMQCGYSLKAHEERMLATRGSVKGQQSAKGGKQVAA